MKWSDEQPTTDGIYFYRPIGGTRAVAQVRDGRIEFPVIGNSSVTIALALFTEVQWAGPIPEPEEA